MMDSDDGMLSVDGDFLDSEDDAEVDEIDEDYVINMEQEMETIKPKSGEDEHPYEILTGDQVVELMHEIIREVNTIVQVSVVSDTVIRADKSINQSVLFCCAPKS